MSCQKTLANLAKVRETGSTWEFHIPRIDTWGYLAVAGVLLPLLKVISDQTYQWLGVLTHWHVQDSLYSVYTDC